MFCLRMLIALSLVSVPAGALLAQAVKSVPYSAQLRTDPAVGNIQGIQRYGRSLRTDPDEGAGFTYHVYPVADTAPPGFVVPYGRLSTQSRNVPGTPLSVQAAEERPEYIKLQEEEDKLRALAPDLSPSFSIRLMNFWQY